MKTKHKLILFDIDGTLVTTSAKDGIKRWQERVIKSLRSIYDVEVNFPDVHMFNGFVDRNLFWSLLREAGVPRSDFEYKYGILSEHFHGLTRADYEEGFIGWKKIPDAEKLLKKITSHNHHAIGIITGNTRANGLLKLEAAGLSGYFSFGAYADTVDDRLELARFAFEEAKKFFETDFLAEESVIIGDTKHDIRSGKSIGSRTVAVLTGLTETRQSLSSENPDLLVDTLMDEKVLRLIGL